MCRYCIDRDNVCYVPESKEVISEVYIDEDNTLGVYVQGDVEYGVLGYGISLKINYCPMYGRKLK